MESIFSPKRTDRMAEMPDKISPEITAGDEKNFFRITATELSDEQKERVATPARTFPEQKSVLAVHWHPEYIPMALIARRIEATFPAKKMELIIPTQHNEIISFNGFSGMEIDCYCEGFNQKIQLLVHFQNSKLAQAGQLPAILEHTFKYRSSQLFELMHTITKPLDESVNAAARTTGASDEMIRFARITVGKLAALLERHGSAVPPAMVKNNLVRNFFDTLRPLYGDTLIDRVQTYLTAVKMIVKDHFPLQYFYRTEEVVEEARALNAGIIIPHPEQFWPILLADYDVDGIEVWNPQSRRYTDFLISVIDRQNSRCGAPDRRLLVFMGDDTHMSEKVRDPDLQIPDKAGREIGYQPAWDDISIRKTLMRAGIDRETVIAEYKARLAG